MQTITTRYAGPTNSHGGRIIARADAGRISVGYNHALDMGANHRGAALALIRKLGWEVMAHDYGLASGSLPGANGMVHVFAADAHEGTDMDCRYCAAGEPMTHQYEPPTPGYLHMTETSGPFGPAGFLVQCRCGWSRGDFATRDDARAAGDAHLAAGNRAL